MVFCPNCYSSKVKKYGTARSGEQRYLCRSCKKQFTERSNTPFSGMRYPRDVILYALNLHLRHGIPLRDISEFLRRSGIEVSHVAIYDWVRKFKGYFMQYLGKYREYSRRWYVKEESTKICGRSYYVYTVHDSNGLILSVRAHPIKSKDGIDEALEGAYSLTGFRPEAIIGGANP